MVTVNKISRVEDAINITLSIAEATMLKRVMGRVAGMGPVGVVTRSLYSQLGKAGIMYDPGLGAREKYLVGQLAATDAIPPEMQS